MKAAILRGAKDIRTETVPDPVCAPHGVIIKVKACGVCGSDLHWYKEAGMRELFSGMNSAEILWKSAKTSGESP